MPKNNTKKPEPEQTSTDAKTSSVAARPPVEKTAESTSKPANSEKKTAAPAPKQTAKPKVKLPARLEIPAGLTFDDSTNILLDSEGEVFIDFERGFEGVPNNEWGRAQFEKHKLIGRLVEYLSNQ